MDDANVRAALRNIAPSDIRPPTDLADIVVRRARRRVEIARVAGAPAGVITLAAAVFLMPGYSAERDSTSNQAAGPVPSSTYTSPEVPATATLPTYPVPSSTTDEAYNDYVTRADAGTPVLARIRASDPDFLTIGLDARRRALVVYRKGGADPRYPTTVEQLPVIVRDSFLSQGEQESTVRAFLAARDDFAKAGVKVSAFGGDLTVGGPVQVNVDRVTPESRQLADDVAPYGAKSNEFAPPMRVLPASHSSSTVDRP